MSADFSLFLHSLATEFDAQAGVKARDHLLRAVGLRMATRVPLPACRTLEDFEFECNATLALLKWGTVTTKVSERHRRITFDIRNVPTIGAVGDPAGLWIACCFAGLIEGWLTQIEECVSEKYTV